MILRSGTGFVMQTCKLVKIIVERLQNINYHTLGQFFSLVNIGPLIIIVLVSFESCIRTPGRENLVNN